MWAINELDDVIINFTPLAKYSAGFYQEGSSISHWLSKFTISFFNRLVLEISLLSLTFFDITLGSTKGRD